MLIINCCSPVAEAVLAINSTLDVTDTLLSKTMHTSSVPIDSLTEIVPVLSRLAIGLLSMTKILCKFVHRMSR